MFVVLCYGDSNTFGRDPRTKKRFDHSIRWPGVMRGALGDGFHVIEEGLNGRTTVWNDPVRGDALKRNGGVYLVPCLESHAPIDLVLLMLGTNDLKAKFSVTAYDVAESIGSLIETIQRSGCGRDDGVPEILLMAPPPMGKLSEYAETFQGAEEKSLRLASLYEGKAGEYGCRFLDLGGMIKTSAIDGLHFDADDHKTAGIALSRIVRDIAQGQERR